MIERGELERWIEGRVEQGWKRDGFEECGLYRDLQRECRFRLKANAGAQRDH